MENVRNYNVGTSDYSNHEVQPWDIWIWLNLNPFEGDIVKRTLRTKSTDSRQLDYEKMKHIASECIRQLDCEEYNVLTPEINQIDLLEKIKKSYPYLKENDYKIIDDILKIKYCPDNQYQYGIIKEFYLDICKQCDIGIEIEKSKNIREEPKIGNIYKHFKRETLENPGTDYLYEILGIGFNSETKEKYVVYKSLYSNKDINIGHICCRPYDMFLSEVDHIKYPNIKQKYRFEKVD